MEENKTKASDLEQEAENIAECSEESKADEVGCDEKPSKCDKKKLKKEEEKVAQLEQSVADAEKKLAEANDKYMRLYAEYDNFRKRSQKEKEATYTDAYIDALTQILPILDNLERAAHFSTEEAESPLAKGLELTLKSFIETLEKMGVKEIEALGVDFDPNVHNAVMHVEDESVGENQVVEVFMKGYIKGEKVLRHSMVKVAN